MKRSATVRPESSVETEKPPVARTGGEKADSGSNTMDDFSLPTAKPRAELVPIHRKGGGTGIESPPVTRLDLDLDLDEPDDPYPLYHLKGRNLVIPVQVPPRRTSLNSGDVFVLDMRQHKLACIVMWTGSEANRREKAAGRQYCDKLKKEVSLSLCFFLCLTFLS